MGFRPQTLRRGLVHRQLLGRQAPQGLLQKSPLAGRPGPRFDPQASLFLVEGGPHHLFLWEPPPILARGLPELVMLQAVGAWESPGIRCQKRSLATRGHPHHTHWDSKAPRQQEQELEDRSLARAL